MDLGEILGRIGYRRFSPGDSRRDGIAAGEVGTDLEQMPGGDHLQPVHQGRFCGIGFGNHQGTSRGTGLQRGGKDSPHCAKLSAQGQFAIQFILRQPLGRKLSRSGEDPHGDGQVETSPLLGQIGGGQVDGDALHREVEMAVEQGAPYPVLALLDRRFGEADDVEGRESVGEVHLDDHLGCIDAGLSPAIGGSQWHALHPPVEC